MEAARERGNAAYKEGRFAAAIDAYSAGIATSAPASGGSGGSSSAPEALLLLRLNRAAAYMAIKAYGAAIDDLAALLAVDAGNVKALLRLALALLALGNVEGAQAVLAAVVSSTLVADAQWPAVKDAQAAVGAVASAVAALSAPLAVLAATPMVSALGGGGASVVDAAALAAAERDAAGAAAVVAAVPSAPLAQRALALALVRARRLDAAAAVLSASASASASASTGGSGGASSGDGSGSGADAAGRLPTAAPITLPDGSSLVVTPPAGDDGSSELEPIAVGLATLALATGSFTEAEAALRGELRADPDGSTPAGAAAASLARAARRLGHLKDAANDKYKAGDYAGAEAGYTELATAAAAALRGYTPAVVHSNLAAVHLAQGRVDAALADTAAGLAAAPFLARLWQRRAACLEAAKPPDREAAARAYAAAQYLGTADDAGVLAKTFAVASKADGDADELDGLLALGHPGDDKSVAAALAPVRPAAAGARGSLPSLLAPAARVAHRLVIVDAFATWCGPCKAIAPYYERLAATHAIPAFIKVDGDVCRGAVTKLGVRAFPTFVAVLDGKEIDRLEGADPRSLDDMVARAVTAWRKGAAVDPSTPPALRPLASSPDCKPDVLAVVGPAWRACHGLPPATAAAAAAAGGAGSAGGSSRR